MNKQTLNDCEYITIMIIYLTRHGQTELNKCKRMQGRIDEPLNETGILQAEHARKTVENIHFDAVYSSPLKRAQKTASIIGNVPEKDVLVDDRIIEISFGKYELRKYYLLGLKMTSFWLLPEVFKAPKSVESIDSMVARSTSFLNDLRGKDYENVLVVCHGGIIRALCGCLEGRKSGIKWRPKPHNCEIREYEIQ